MRPHLLSPLFASAAALPGIGPKTGKLLDRLLGPSGGAPARVIDVLFHLPVGTVDRRHQPPIAEAQPGQVVTVKGRVTDHRAPPPRSKAPYKVLIEDDTADVLLVFFLSNHAWIEKSLPLGAERWVSGKLELYDGHRQMVHPDKVMDAAAFAAMPLTEPVYGLTEGLYPRVLTKAVDAALTRVPFLPEWRADPPPSKAWEGDHAQHGGGGAFPPSRSGGGGPPKAVEGAAAEPRLAPGSEAPLPPSPPCGWSPSPVCDGGGSPTFGEALAAVHRPAEPKAIAPEAPARRRLAYDELFAHQVALALMRKRLRVRAGRPSAAGQAKAEAIVAALPFALTGAQAAALAEIRADLAAPARMLRLLQGDVGSGKTLVALLAMADVVEAGRQAVLMAPTEILARQHFSGLAPRALAAGIRVALITGRDTPAERRRTLEGLASGAIDVAVGTHALIGEKVAFRDLGLAEIGRAHV